MAGALGFEPRVTGPKPVALPLGHAPIRCGDLPGPPAGNDGQQTLPDNIISGRPPTSNGTLGQRTASLGLRAMPRWARGARRLSCGHWRSRLYTGRTLASRSVAQLGSAPRSGRGGRRFKSCHSDQLMVRLMVRNITALVAPYGAFMNPNSDRCAEGSRSLHTQHRSES